MHLYMVYTYECMHMCVHTFWLLHVCVHTYECACVYVYIGMCLCVCVCMKYTPHFLLKIISRCTGETGYAGNVSVAVLTSVSLPLVVRGVPA